MIALGYALALAIGLSLGLLGGGGSILTVPVLVYTLGLDMKEAVPMSLVVVGLVSVLGVARHHRAQNIRWDAALAFAPAATAGAIAGARLASNLTGRTQLQIFAVLMFVAAISMYRPPAGWLPQGSKAGRNWLLIGVVGALVGGLTGLLGVGGGFLYVPALVLLCGLPMRNAVGTSLVLIIVSCITAFVSHKGWVAMDWQVLGIFTVLAGIGVIAGSALSRRVDPDRLRKVFAALLVVMSGFVFLRPR